MILDRHRHAAGTFTNRQDAEEALSELNSAGFSNVYISVVPKDLDCEVQLNRTSISHRFGDEAQAGTATAGTLTGSMLGAIGGCLVGLGILSIPGIGLAVAIGTSSTALFTTLAGAGIGAASGGLIEILASLGISEDQQHPPKVERKPCSEYEYLVMVDGTDREVRRAESILNQLY
jgi:hypothetical protein